MFDLRRMGFSILATTAGMLAMSGTSQAELLTYTFPVCGAPNSVEPGWVPNGDPMVNGEMTLVIDAENGLLTLQRDPHRWRQRSLLAFAHFVHHSHDLVKLLAQQCHAVGSRFDKVLDLTHDVRHTYAYVCRECHVTTFLACAPRTVRAGACQKQPRTKV